MKVGRHGLTRARVPAAFDVGAGAYDRLVGLNPGYHQHLRLSAQRMRLPARGAGLTLLDAGCGTGASTAALLAAAPEARIVAIDASEEMLRRARAKPWPSTVRFEHTPVEDYDSGPFDGIFAAYLLRNLDDPDAQLRRFARLLRPGASLAVHEYSVADSWRARVTWHAVCWSIIIPLGRIATGDATLYRHLWRSVTTFDGTTVFQNRLRNSGFTRVHRETMPGWHHNVVHTFVADAPERGR